MGGPKLDQPQVRDNRRWLGVARVTFGFSVLAVVAGFVLTIIDARLHLGSSGSAFGALSFGLAFIPPRS